MKKLNLKSIAALTAATAMTLSLTACTQSTGGDTGGAGNTQQQSGGTTYNVAVVKQMDHASLDEIANAITAPAIEFKTEGFVLGVGAKMFTIAGPVIVYGLAASVVYGFIYWLYTIL